MMINPKHLVQQSNIAKNKTKTIKLKFADDFIFYKILDKEIVNGKSIIITFPGEKIEEGSGMHERINSCSNSREFLELIAETTGKLIEIFKVYSTQDFSEIAKKLQEADIRVSYSSYKVEYDYDNDNGEYFLKLEPAVDGVKGNGLMFLA